MILKNLIILRLSVSHKESLVISVLHIVQNLSQEWGYRDLGIWGTIFWVIFQTSLLYVEKSASCWITFCVIWSNLQPSWWGANRVSISQDGWEMGWTTGMKGQNLQQGQRQWEAQTWDVSRACDLGLFSLEKVKKYLMSTAT